MPMVLAYCISHNRTHTPSCWAWQKTTEATCYFQPIKAFSQSKGVTWNWGMFLMSQGKSLKFLLWVTWIGYAVVSRAVQIWIKYFLDHIVFYLYFIQHLWTILYSMVFYSIHIQRYSYLFIFNELYFLRETWFCPPKESAWTNAVIWILQHLVTSQRQQLAIKSQTSS